MGAACCSERSALREVSSCCPTCIIVSWDSRWPASFKARPQFLWGSGCDSVGGGVTRGRGHRVVGAIPILEGGNTIARISPLAAHLKNEPCIQRGVKTMFVFFGFETCFAPTAPSVLWALRKHIPTRDCWHHCVNPKPQDGIKYKICGGLAGCISVSVPTEGCSCSRAAWSSIRARVRLGPPFVGVSAAVCC